MTDDSPIHEQQVHALTVAVGALMRQFKLEPGLLAGSAYADLHVNDVSLLSVLSGSDDWTVRGLAQALTAPDSTVSSALDRLEGRGLVARRRRSSDRRVVRVELTGDGEALASRIRSAQMENSRRMLARLSTQDRLDLIRLVTDVAKAGDQC